MFCPFNKPVNIFLSRHVSRLTVIHKWRHIYGKEKWGGVENLGKIHDTSHSMARANLNKSEWLVTNTTTASKYIPKGLEYALIEILPVRCYFIRFSNSVSYLNLTSSFSGVRRTCGFIKMWDGGGRVQNVATKLWRHLWTVPDVKSGDEVCVSHTF